MEIVIWLGIIVLLLWIAHGMAVTRERSPGAWMFWTFWFGIFALIALLIIGDHPRKRYER